MALLERGALRDDPFTSIADDAALPDSAALISHVRLARDGIPEGRNAPLGVILPPDVAPEAIAAYLPRLALVALRLPGPRDGRAFTQARTLREHHGFTGEIRATGHVLPDHVTMLTRLGVSTIELPAGADPAAWQRMPRIIDIAYQPALDTGRSLGLRRHRLEHA